MVEQSRLPPGAASREAWASLMEEAGNRQTVAGLWPNRHYRREFERRAAVEDALAGS
ncbi:hypothetical protein [Amycolatopsis sp. cmx-4-61]|uniref:hypothetical protein n=1 Tax=Amycolatopsis sp. cmx-4-61 TaxID=2790937 RepID=UPI003978398C